MEKNIKESQIYILHQNDEIIIRNSNDDNEFYYIQSHEYVDSLAKDTNLCYSKISVEKNNSNIFIENINDQVENVHTKIIDIKNNNKEIKLNEVSQLDDEITNLKASLKYLHKFPNKLNIGNIKGVKLINSEFSKFIGSSLNDCELLHQILGTLSQNISLLIEIINHILNFINVLTVTHFKIFEIIKNAMILMNNFNIKQKTETKFDIKSSTIKSILIDQNQYPILVFTEDKSDTIESSKLNTETDKKAKNIFLNILTQYYDKELQIFKQIKTDKEKTEGIEDYFINEVNNFKNNLTTIINKNQSFSAILNELNEFSKKFKNIIDKKPIKIYKNQSTSDFYWFYLLNITKFNFYTNSKIILTIIESIFSFYFENIGNSQINTTYEDFIKAFGKYKRDNKTSLKSMFEKIINEIQQSKNFYFYFDVLFQKVIKNLLDQNFFTSQYQKANSNDYNDDDDDDGNKYILIKESNFETKVTTSKLLYDKNLFLVLEIDYKTDIDEIQEQLRDREILIYEKNYSKFIVHCIEKIDKNRIIIPFYSNRTLNTIINHSTKKQSREIELTLVDKIVIILEIAIALRDLHLNHEYHGNLSSQIIFINSKNDAYLGGFSYDRRAENQETKPNSPFYYHSPESVIFNDKNNDEDDILKQQLNDVYSFGVLMHEILTEIEITSRFGNANRSFRLQKLKDNFFNFLLETDPDFYKENDNIIDQKGNSLIGFKEIIEKCMKNDSKDRFSTFEEIINSIKKLNIYQINKVEIEYRIENASKSSDYKCTFADLVESYYKGQLDCFEDIQKSLEIYRTMISKDKTKTDINDVIKNIFEAFDMKKNENFSFIFEDIFNYIIQMITKSKLDENKAFNYDDGLLKLSNNANIGYKLIEDENNEFLMMNQDFDFIVPISTLASFIKNNEDKIENLIPTWMYFIAREVQFIHSKNLYHGSISQKSIGIYYNRKTETFIPSIILFYKIYSQKNKIIFNQNLSKSKDEIIIENQKKDFKQLIKILKYFNIIPETMIDELKETESDNIVVVYLYNFIIKKCNEEQNIIFNNNYSTTFKYSDFQITYPTMINLLDLLKNNSFDDLFLDFETILKIIFGFLNNTYLHSDKSIIENIPQIIQQQQQQQITNFDEIICLIKEKCSLLWNNISSQFPFIIYEETEEKMFNKSENKEEKITKSKDFNLIFRDKTQKQKTWYNKPVPRRLEINDLYLRTVEFLIKRYIFSLDPSMDFKLAVKINNKDYSNYQDIQIKSDDIRSIVNKLGFTEVKNENGCVVVTLDFKSRNKVQEQNAQ